MQGVTFKVTTSTGEFVPAENGQISSNGLYFTDKDGKITIHGVVGTLVVTENGHHSRLHHRRGQPHPDGGGQSQ